MPWYVLNTKYRSEKAVANRLSSMGIEAYCPLLKTERRWTDRIKIIEEPLFRSYCFVKLDDKERNKVFNISGVVRYLFYQNKPAIVRDNEINAIKFMVSEVDHKLLKVRAIQTGDKLRVASGPFYNTTGRVIYQQGQLVTIVLDTIQLILTVNQSNTVTQI